MATGSLTIYTVAAWGTYDLYADGVLIAAAISGPSYTFTVDHTMSVFQINNFGATAGGVGFDGIDWTPSGGATTYYPEIGAASDPSSIFTYNGFPGGGWYFAIYNRAQAGQRDGNVDSGGTSVGNSIQWDAASLAGTVPPTASFSADPGSGPSGSPVVFTDTSAGGPTSWAWDFGDGSTSTLQDPEHTYIVPGSYLVTLTVTNGAGSDTTTGTVTALVDVGYTPPPPGGALLEIYAAAPGSARWGVAHWGEDLWSSAGWRDVTPQGVDAVIHWGSSQAEQGILSQPDPASWAVDFYDPERILDPANADGPYYTDLRPGLPIRLSHHELEIIRGYVESIGHSYAKGPQNGYIRATDIISRLANAAVPADITLADTLYARATDAIAAAGLAIELEAVIGTDPALAPWSEHDPTIEWSAWQWIADAAQQVLYVPLVRPGGVLGFRAWSAPLVRGRSIDAPELLDLQVVGDYAGQYSVIEALQTVAEGGVLEQRALTPVPRYGKRTFSRQEPTPDIDTWLDAVLADRALPALRWIPGEVYPLTADSVHRFATIEAVELVSMAVPEQDPPVSATAIIVGGEISVVGKYASEAIWSFTFEAAQTALEPLIETGGDPTDYLLATGGDQFLYPSL